MIYKLFTALSVLALASASLDGTEDTEEFPHPPGSVYVAPKDIPKGCARFYISDPIVESGGTKYWQVCTQVQRDHAAKMSIGAGIFAKLKDSYGEETSNSISFISTGPSTWVDIYAQNSQGGDHYEITPLRDVDLALVTSEDNPSETTFNDNILSGFIRSTDAAGENPDGLLSDVGVIPVAVWYRFANVPRQEPEDGCVYFYDRDPTNQDSNGFVSCVSHDQHLAHVSEFDLEKRGLILLGKQPFVNGTITSAQQIGEGGMDEDGNVLENEDDEADSSAALKAEPWGGDASHEKEAADKYNRKAASKKTALRRKLQTFVGPNISTPPAHYNGSHEGHENETFLGIVEEDMEMAVEYVWEGLDWLYEGVVQTFFGEQPDPEQPDPNPTSGGAGDAVQPAAAVAVDPEDHTGIKYVEVGSDVDAALWTNSDFTGSQQLVKEGNAKLLDAHVNSFFLISKKWTETKVKPEGGYEDLSENVVVAGAPDLEPRGNETDIDAEEANYEEGHKKNMRLDVEQAKIAKAGKKLSKMEDKKMHDKERRQAHMMRNS